MKILHTADIHLGAKFSVLGDKADEYREQLKKTFVKMIDLSLKQKVDLVLIAGDLFDSNFPAPSTVSLVRQQFKRLADKNIGVVILPGTHDCLDNNSVYWRENFAKNVSVFKKAEGHVYPDLDLTIWAKPNTANQSTENPLINVGTGRRPVPTNDRPKSVPQKTKYNIAMAHGSVVELAPKMAVGQFPMHLTDVTNSPFDYIALGHWHSFVGPEKFQNKACYSGSPEPINLTQKGAGYIVRLGTGRDLSLEIKPIKIGTTEFDEIAIDVSLVESAEELEKEILKKASENLIYQVKLQGLLPIDLNLDLPALEERLSEKFFRLVIIDKTQLAPQRFETGQYPQELVIGQFVRLMQARLQTTKDEKEKQLVKQAMQLGLTALTNEGFEL